MSESGQRKRIIKALRPLHGIPVENPVRPGTPDVNYIEGWIELKWMRRWPTRDYTMVRLPHFTMQQRRFLRDRYEKGGNAWLLLQVGKEWLLFTGRDACDYVGQVSRKGLYKTARVRWTKGLVDEDRRICLTRDWENWNGLPIVRPSSSFDAGSARVSSGRQRG